MAVIINHRLGCTERVRLHAFTGPDANAFEQFRLTGLRHRQLNPVHACVVTCERSFVCMGVGVSTRHVNIFECIS